MNEPEKRIYEKVANLRDVLLGGLIERETPLRLALLAALSGEHLLLVGPPGTAKSELARRLRHAFKEATYFERLLTRFSTPEELFGPLSLKGLEEDRYERQTRGYLPEASVAFLDEIFKANSAILNALLTLLNEREFDNGVSRIQTPLISVVGASNELPEGEELHALYDRFLLRYQMSPVSDEGFGALLELRDSNLGGVPSESLKFDGSELPQIRRSAEAVKVPVTVTGLLREFRVFLREQKMVVSDRRWRKIVKLLQVSAWSNGRGEVSIWDAWLLQHCAWEKPEQRAAVREWYEKRLGANQVADPARLTKLVNAQEKILHEEQTAQAQLRDNEGNLLFLELGSTTKKKRGRKRMVNKDGEELFLHPETRRGYTNYDPCTLDEVRRHFSRYSGNFKEYVSNANNFAVEDADLLPAVGPQRYSRDHIEGRQRVAKKCLDTIQAHLEELDGHIASLVSTVDRHLWIEPGFSTVAKRNLEETRASVLKALERMKTVWEGFGKLPEKMDPVEGE